MMDDAGTGKDAGGQSGDAKPVAIWREAQARLAVLQEHGMELVIRPARPRRPDDVNVN